MEQRELADYISLQYPNVVFHSDFGSGTRLSMGQAKRQKALNAGRKGWPDMFIAEPVGKYHGLFIELKRSGTSLHKLNGDWANPHYQDQAEVLEMLTKKGYRAEFAVGFGGAKELIDEYLRGKNGKS